MPLQTGSWTANFGGQNAQLTIVNVSANGQVDLTIGLVSYGGFWDEDAQRLSIISKGQGAVQEFTGYLFTDPVNIAGVNGAVIFTLVGIVENFGTPPRLVGPVPTAKRSSFGWYAQIGVD